MENQSKKIDSLQVVRALAFLGVFLNHAIKTFPGEVRAYRFYTTGLGAWGVSVFLILSGFVMTYAYWERPLSRKLRDVFAFAARKIWRLYPLHLIMLFWGALYLVLQHKNLLRIAKGLLLTIPLLQTWVPVWYQAINSVAWYLSVCLFLYFSFPYLLALLRRESAIAALLQIVAIFLAQLLVGFCVAQFTNLNVFWITYCHPLFRLGDFAIGASLAVIFKNWRLSAGGSWATTTFFTLLEGLGLAVGAAVCILFANPDLLPRWLKYACLFIPGNMLLIYSFAWDGGLISRCLKNPVVFWLANISPHAFLIHRQVINYFHAMVVAILHHDHIPYWLAVAVPFAGTVAAVYLYRLLENKIRAK